MLRRALPLLLAIGVVGCATLGRNENHFRPSSTPKTVEEMQTYFKEQYGYFNQNIRPILESSEYEYTDSLGDVIKTGDFIIFAGNPSEGLGSAGSFSPDGMAIWVNYDGELVFSYNVFREEFIVGETKIRPWADPILAVARGNVAGNKEPFRVALNLVHEFQHELDYESGQAGNPVVREYRAFRKSALLSQRIGVGIDELEGSDYYRSLMKASLGEIREFYNASIEQTYGYHRTPYFGPNNEWVLPDSIRPELLNTE
jgi:hypothetical protein